VLRGDEGAIRAFSEPPRVADDRIQALTVEHMTSHDTTPPNNNEPITDECSCCYNRLLRSLSSAYFMLAQ
jgi:hypothetical protein